MRKRTPWRRKRPRADGNVLQVWYTPDVARQICERIAAGESWQSMCNLGGLPCQSAIYRWRKTNPRFAEALAQAREIAREVKLYGRPLSPRPALFDQLEKPLMSDDAKPARWRAPPRKKPQRKDGKFLQVRYGEAVVNRICERLAAGERWKDICNTDGLPCYAVLLIWMRRYPEFKDAVEAARAFAADLRFGEALDVAAASTPASVQSDKLHVATLLHHAEKLDPERFGRGGGRGRAGAEAGEAKPMRRIVVRYFEKAVREDGTEYVRAIDDIQEVEDRR